MPLIKATKRIVLPETAAGRSADSRTVHHFRFAEHVAQRRRDRAVVLFAADLFVARASEADEMIARDAALLRVEFRQLGRLADRCC